MRVSVQLAATFERLALLNAVMHHALQALRRAGQPCLDAANAYRATTFASRPSAP